MNIELIAIIMSSTVVSVVISSILNFVQNRRDNNLQYITLERKIWREQIRNISEEISTAGINNISIVLDKLKVRINAYGNCYGTYSVSVLDDYHIWKIIDTTKKVSQSSSDEFEKCKDLLIDSISLLLKYDWDKSKWEIKGNVYFVLERLCLILFISVYEGLLFFSYGFNLIEVLGYSLTGIFIFSREYAMMSKLMSVSLEDYKLVRGTDKLVKRHNISIICTSLAILGTLMYTHGRPLEINISNIINTLNGILSYSMVMIASFLIWHEMWFKRYVNKFDDFLMYYLCTDEIIDRLKIIMNNLLENQ